MTVKIKNRRTDEVLMEVDADTLLGANLRYANLRYANLRYANLWGANLRYADLRGANLLGANLLGANLWGADLRGANLRYADLRGANLRGADLLGADLRGANLRYAVGDGIVIRCAQFEKYHVVVCDDWLQIGCEGHRVYQWMAFSDDEIDAMDEGALEWWKQYKEAVLAFADCP